MKTLLRQFDVPKAKANVALAEEDEELYELAEGVDEGNEDEPTGAGDDFVPPSGVGEMDDVEGWVDEIAAMTDEERLEFQQKVRPVRLVLTKVSFQTHCTSSMGLRLHYLPSDPPICVQSGELEHDSPPSVQEARGRAENARAFDSA